MNPTPARTEYRGLVRTTASVVAAAALLAALPLAAQDEPAEQPRVHVVVKGETLWDIARVYLNDPFLWPEIFRLNTDVVEDPALIYPRERLVLPGTFVRVADEGPSIFYQPAVQPTDGPTLGTLAGLETPAVTQGDYYRAAWVARPGTVRPIGRLVAVEDRSVIDNRMPPQINLYDRVYVRVGADAVRVGDRIQFVREGREVPGSGRMYTPSGMGTVAALDAGTATVVVIRMFDRVELGDAVLPVERFPLTAGVHPRPVEADLQGRITAFKEIHPVQQREDILFLDVGTDAGVALGDEFEIYTPSEQQDWGTRPEVRVARVQIVKVTGGTASARVTQVQQPNIAVGLPVRRVARMP